MARYCSAQDNVRTRQSPPYRETIRVNVLHGRKSMSWAKSVLPLFTGTSSETFRKVPDRVQIDTTLVRQNRVRNHAFIGRHRLLNRTAVSLNTDNETRCASAPQNRARSTNRSYKSNARRLGSIALQPVVRTRCLRSSPSLRRRRYQ